MARSKEIEKLPIKKRKESIAAAVKSVMKKSMTIKEAAKSYKVPSSYIRQKLKKDKPLRKAIIFSRKDVEKIRDHVKKICNTQFGFSITDLRKLAYEYAIKLPNCPYPKTWDYKKMATINWLHSFLAEYPDLKRILNKKHSNACICIMGCHMGPEGKEAFEELEVKYLIARVYHYLQKEVVYLQTCNDVSILLNILRRTAEATGVCEQTISSILEEEKNTMFSLHNDELPANETDMNVDSLVEDVDSQNEDQSSNSVTDSTAVSTVSECGTVRSDPVSQASAASLNPITESNVVNLNPVAKSNVVSLKPKPKSNVGSSIPVVKTTIVSFNPVVNSNVVSSDLVAKSNVVSLDPVAKSNVMSLDPVARTNIVSLKPVVKSNVVSVNPVAKSNIVRLNSVAKSNVVNFNLVRMSSAMTANPVPISNGLSLTTVTESNAVSLTAPSTPILNDTNSSDLERLQKECSTIKSVKVEFIDNSDESEQDLAGAENNEAGPVITNTFSLLNPPSHVLLPTESSRKCTQHKTLVKTSRFNKEQLVRSGQESVNGKQDTDDAVVAKSNSLLKPRHEWIDENEGALVIADVPESVQESVNEEQKTEDDVVAQHNSLQSCGDWIDDDEGALVIIDVPISEDEVDGGGTGIKDNVTVEEVKLASPKKCVNGRETEKGNGDAVVPELLSSVKSPPLVPSRKSNILKEWHKDSRIRQTPTLLSNPEKQQRILKHKTEYQRRYSHEQSMIAQKTNKDGPAETTGADHQQDYSNIRRRAKLNSDSTAIIPRQLSSEAEPVTRINDRLLFSEDIDMPTPDVASNDIDHTHQPRLPQTNIMEIDNHKDGTLSHVVTDVPSTSSMHALQSYTDLRKKWLHRQYKEIPDVRRHLPMYFCEDQFHEQKATEASTSLARSTRSSRLSVIKATNNVS